MQKIEKVLMAMAEQRVDGLLLMRDANLRYVSGFTGSESFVILSEQGRIFITDSRYTEQAEQECPGFEIIKYRDHFPSLEDTITQVCNDLKVKSLGFEQEFITFEVYEKIRKVLGEPRFVPTLGIVESVRYVKEEKEIEFLKKAAEIADAAFADLLGLIKPGITEQDIERELEYLIKKKGAFSTGFPTIVASGPRGSLPHAIPSEREIQMGDFITMDFGALYQGYRSDMTRTVLMGQPSAKQKEVYEVVKNAQEAGVKAIKAGIKGSVADNAARSVIENAGYGPNFGHGLGHGIGLEIHEEPFMSKRCEKILMAGTVITVEPGIYLPNWGGVRIEDSVLVTSEGSEIITRASKDLIIL